jgi:uncharacterized protein (TIRG00374 family)
MKSLGTKWMRILFQALGIALFVVILTRVNLRDIVRAYRHMSPIAAVVGLALLCLLTLSKSYRWKVIVAAQGTVVSHLQAFMVYSASLYLGVVTPARIGDFAKSLYLMNTGLSAGKALFSSFADRLFDIIFLAVVGYVSLLLFPGIFDNQLLLSTLLLAVVLLTGMACFWRRDILHAIMKRFVSGIPRSAVRTSLDTVIGDGLAEFATLRGRTAAIVTVLTLVSGVIHYLFFVVFAAALEIGASVPVVIASVSAAIFTALLPVSLSGLGTRELVLILIFERVGLSREAAVTFSFSFILVYLVQGLMGLVCWLATPLHLKKARETLAGAGGRPVPISRQEEP